MAAVSDTEAQARLPELLERVAAGEVVVLTKEGLAAAWIVGPQYPGPLPGRCIGMMTIVSDDDDHLEHFKEYMP